MRVSLEVKLFIFFTSILSVIIILSWETKNNNNNYRDNVHWVEHSQEVLVKSEEVFSLIEDIESKLTIYAITGDESFLSTYQSLSEKVFSRLSQLQSLTKDNPSQQKKIDSLKVFIKSKMDFSSQVIAVGKTKGYMLARDLIASQKNMESEELEDILNRFKMEEKGLLSIRKAANEKKIDDFNYSYNLQLISISIIFLILFFILRHTLINRKKSEKSLLESQQLLQSIVDNASSFIYVKDLQGKYMMVNNSYPKLFGISKKDMIGKTAFDLLNHELALKLKKEDEELIRENKIIETEMEVLIGGKTYDFFSVRFPLIDSGGKIYATAAVYTDITEIKKQSNFIKDLYDNAPCGYYSIDGDGKFINANNTTLQWLGYKKTELLGKSILEILTSEGAEIFKELFPVFKQRGYLENLELFYTRKDGSTFPVVVNSSAVKNEFGDFLHTRSIIVDITERKKLEADLIRSNEKFLRLFYSSPLAMIIRNLDDGRIVDINEEYERLLGYKKEEVVGKTSFEMGIILNQEITSQILKEAAVKKSLKNIETTLYNNKKEPVDVLVSIERIQLADRDCILSALVNITQLKKTEEQLKFLNNELESFTYSVSHDLRAPLRIINGYAQLIKEVSSKTLTEEPKRMLENIIVNAIRMGKLIDDLLNFSRLGRKELFTHDTDMKAVVQSVLKEQINGNINYNVKVHNLPQCYSDSILIKQVWENLISNAVKYSAHKPNPAIEIGSIKENNNTVYYIKDNGAGFDMKYYNKLFGVFQRLHSESEFEGTGVGLALTQRILLKHGGKIWADSKLNEGSTFYFTL